jgi:hypothetical protein
MLGVEVWFHLSLGAIVLIEQRSASRLGRCILSPVANQADLNSKRNLRLCHDTLRSLYSLPNIVRVINQEI